MVDDAKRDEKLGESEPLIEAGSAWKELYKKEDYWSIWLGFALIAASLYLFLPRAPEGMTAKIETANTVMSAEAQKAPFKTVAWFQAEDSKKKIKATSEPFAKTVATWIGKPHGWKSNPLDSFFMFESKAAGKKESAQAKFDAAAAKSAETLAAAEKSQAEAQAAGFEAEEKNQAASTAIAAWREARKGEASASKKLKAAKPYCQIAYLLGLGIFLALFFGIGMRVMGQSFLRFSVGFAFIFGLAILAYVFAAQSNVKAAGIGYAAWAIVFGLLISNTIGTPRWIMPAVQTEFFIKTGLVLLGSEILFGKIIQIGIPGIFVAWVVTPIVLVSTFLFGQKVLKMPSKTLNITIAADMSVCGVSAAIATAAACRAKKEELTLAVGLSLIFTSIMMVVMPNLIKFLGMPDILGGAWIGGTIDATGAVAAAGEFLSERGMYVAATIKMIQNVLIGVVAFCVALYWCLKVEREQGRKVGPMEIWYRFPKFVLGFVGASVLFSLIYQSMGDDVGYTMIDNGVIRGVTKTFRGWFFCLAFVSIGLATNFRELAHYFKGGKPLILYVCGQTLNLCLTLLMAYLMFYKIFPHITEKI